MVAPRRKSLGGCSGGFTLIELLIAVVILSVMLVLAFNGLRLGIASWDRVGDRADASEQMRGVEHFLRTRLEQARALADPDQPGSGIVSFAGTDSTLRFVAPMPGQVVQGGLYWLTVETRPDSAGGTDLVLAYELYQGAGWERLSDDLSGEVILYRDVDALKLAYFGAGNLQEAPRWRDTWQDMGRLPTLIKMAVRPRGHGRRAWPVLLAAPRTGGYDTGAQGS
jgi:general secretion pathway protein J